MTSCRRSSRRLTWRWRRLTEARVASTPHSATCSGSVARLGGRGVLAGRRRLAGRGRDGDAAIHRLRPAAGGRASLGPARSSLDSGRHLEQPDPQLHPAADRPERPAGLAALSGPGGEAVLFRRDEAELVRPRRTSRGKTARTSFRSSAWSTSRSSRSVAAGAGGLPRAPVLLEEAGAAQRAAHRVVPLVAGVLVDPLLVALPDVLTGQGLSRSPDRPS